MALRCIEVFVHRGAQRIAMVDVDRAFDDRRAVNPDRLDDLRQSIGGQRTGRHFVGRSVQLYEGVIAHASGPDHGRFNLAPLFDRTEFRRRRY